MNGIRKLILFLFFSWLFILFARTGIYVLRIYGELRFPPPKTFKDVDTCREITTFRNIEERGLYNYARIGKACAK